MVKRTTKIQKANELDTPAPFKLGEMSVSGNRIIAGLPNNELKRELNFPHNIKTYRQMLLHPAVNAPISLYESMLAKANFRVIPVANATAKEKFQAKKVEEMLNDMETPLPDVIKASTTCLRYGFAPLEKVFRYRNKADGSQYDDGLIGIKKLSLMNQQSIERFYFDETGNNVTGLKQDLSTVSDPYGRYTHLTGNERPIPREKFMLFTTGNDKSNPYGTSPLRNIFLAWKYLSAIEELEAAGVARDLQGLPFMRIPAQYMSADASTENKASLEQFKNILRNLQQNSQAGVLLPSDVDPETKAPLFGLELLSTVGKKSFDTEAIKTYYRSMVFIGMNADILLLGNTSVGSFALGAIKGSLTGSTAENYLNDIIAVFNNDLIKHIYELNGWNSSRRCTLDAENFGEVDLDTYSKFLQRVGSVGYLPRSLDVVNDVMSKMGLDSLPESTNLDDVLPESKSKASEGMKTAGEGTANNPSGSDTSSLNTENAA